MQRGDVKEGDEVKNGRSGKWGRVVDLDVDAVTGRILRVRVRRRLGADHWQHEPRWWDASNIVMVENAK